MTKTRSPWVHRFDALLAILVLLQFGWLALQVLRSPEQLSPLDRGLLAGACFMTVVYALRMALGSYGKYLRIRSEEWQ